MDHIYSVTTDNGKNMVTAIELLKENATAECLNNEEMLEMLDSITFPKVQLLRCAADTLHLYVRDVNIKTEFFPKVSTCRQICKVLRTGKYRRILLQKDKQIPTLGVPARWNSSYKMLKVIINDRNTLTPKDMNSLLIVRLNS